VLGAQPFNYTDAIDALPNAIHAFGGPAEVTAGNYIDARGLFEDAGADDAYVPSGFTGYWHGPNDVYSEPNLGGAIGVNPNQNLSNALASIGVNSVGVLSGATNTVNNYGNPYTVSSKGAGVPPGVGSSVSDAGTFVLSETSLDMHCWGQNPVVVAKLQLNGQDRFSEREGSYFSWVQPYQSHTRNPDEGINVYSFALRPEEHQPSGTCNFSRIDNATLQLVLSNATVEGTKTAKVRVYATNYNVLRIMSGMGGLAYSN
jgi:hypothetical protein